MSTGRLVVAMTGASGAIYGVRFLRQAVQHYEKVYLALSDQAAQVIKTELDLVFDGDFPQDSDLLGEPSERLVFLGRKDYF
jgi:flavin prenyltransferase